MIILNKKRIFSIVSLLVLIMMVLGCNKEDKKTIEKSTDNTVPTISVIQEEILIDGDTEFDPVSNVDVKYGVAQTEYMVPFYSIISCDNVSAAQFHPEKSGPVGIQIMRNFMEYGE